LSGKHALSLRSNHPHICTVQDVGDERRIDFLALEYLEGQTLADLARGWPQTALAP
jgi:hypothetical protein